MGTQRQDWFSLRAFCFWAAWKVSATLGDPPPLVNPPRKYPSRSCLLFAPDTISLTLLDDKYALQSTQELNKPSPHATAQPHYTGDSVQGGPRHQRVYEVLQGILELCES